MQRNFAKNPTFADGTPAAGVVYDGRDTGTVVCPNADLKIFLIADVEVRAQRRYKEFLEKGIQKSYEKVLADMKERDERDKNRSSAPMKPADDAVIIDCSTLSVDDLMKIIMPLVEQKLSA